MREQGKTSLCKNLLGEKFNPREPPTALLAVKKCSFTANDKEWQIYDDDANSELDRAKEWYILDKISSHCLLSVNNVSKFALFFAACCFFLIPLVHVIWFSVFGLCLIYEAGRLKSMLMLVFLSWFSLGPALGYGNTNIMNAIWLNRLLTFLYMLISFTTEILSPTYPGLSMMVLALVVYIFGYVSSCPNRTIYLTAILMKIFGLLVYFKAEESHFPCLVAISDKNMTEFFILLFCLTAGVVATIWYVCRKQENKDDSVKVYMFCIIPLFAIACSDSLDTLIVIALSGIISGIAFVMGTVHGRPKTHSPATLDSFQTFSVIIIPSSTYAFSYSFQPIILGQENKPIDLDVVLTFFMWWICYSLYLCILYVVIPYIADTKLPKRLFGSISVNDLFNKLEFLVSNGKHMLDCATVLTILELANGSQFHELSGLLISAKTSIIVFDVTRFLKEEDRNREFERIQTWFHSLGTSTKAQVMLVGTHIDHTNDEMISKIQEYFKSRLSTVRSGNMVHVVWNGDKPFFGIDNSRYLVDDSSCLKQTIMKLTIPAKETLIPISWLQFLCFIQNERRKQFKSQSVQNLVVDIGELRFRYFVETLTHIRGAPVEETKDVKQWYLNNNVDVLKDGNFLELLQYFVDIGEVFYDKNDDVIPRHVVLDPYLLSKIVARLISYGVENGNSSSEPKENCQQPGILTSRTAASLLGVEESSEFVHDLLTILEGTGVISKIASRELPADEASPEDVYVVPSKLPKGNPTLPPETHLQHHYYFDFGDSSINKLFPLLLARCQRLSDLPYATNGELYLYRESGIFTYGPQFFFRLSLIQHATNQNLIEVALKIGHEGDPVQFLRHIWQLIQHLRRKDLEGIKFHCGPICAHEKPHQSHRGQQTNDDYIHVLKLADNTCFPDLSVIPMCLGRETGDTSISYVSILMLLCNH